MKSSASERETKKVSLSENELDNPLSLDQENELDELDSLTDEEVEAEALADPDCPTLA